MKNHEFGIEPRILAVPQKAQRGIPLGELKKLPTTYIAQFVAYKTKEER